MKAGEPLWSVGDLRAVSGVSNIGRDTWTDYPVITIFCREDGIASFTGEDRHERAAQVKESLEALASS